MTGYDRERCHKMGKILETAEFWNRLEIAVIPIAYKLKQPKIKWLPYTERLPEQAELGRWFASDLVNIGIVTGWKNLTIIDFDDMDVFMSWYIWADNKGGMARKVSRGTRIHKSARGAHVFVMCETAENMKLPKIDILARRKYALLPPSVHPSGLSYTVYRDALPMPVRSLYDILPKRLLDEAVTKKANTILSGQDAEPVVDSVAYDPWAAAGMPEQESGLINRIREQVRIEDILGGWETSGGNGRWKMTRCPFHDDRNPSFWLDSVNQICGCHSGCTPLPLDVIDLYARLHSVDNLTAIRQLAERLT